MMAGSETPVVLQSEGQQVVGMFHRPARQGPSPAVLMLHGFTGSKHEIRRLFVLQARALARQGIASLRIDFRGCGDSGGEFQEMTVGGMCRDAGVAWNWLAAQDGVDAGRMGLLGMSLGGMIASLTIGARPGAKTLVLWAPVTHPRRMIASRSTPESQRQMAETGIADMNGWAVGQVFVHEMLASDPLAALARCDAPLLVGHGEQDATVPVADSREACAALRSAGREIALETLPGADHGFSSLSVIERLQALSCGWLGSDRGRSLRRQGCGRDQLDPHQPGHHQRHLQRGGRALHGAARRPGRAAAGHEARRARNRPTVGGSVVPG